MSDPTRRPFGSASRNRKRECWILNLRNGRTSRRLSCVGEFGRGSLARLHRRYPAPGEIRVCGTHKATRVAVVHVRQGRPTKPLAVLAGMRPRHLTQWYPQPHSAGDGPGMRPGRGAVGDAEEQAAGFSLGRSSLRRQSRPIRGTVQRLGGSYRLGKDRTRTCRRLESIPEPGPEPAIVGRKAHPRENVR